MTKTAYASRLSDVEVAEQSKDMSADDREQFRLENATSPLFDMWLRFQDAFANRAIDRLDISDDDAEAAAKLMDGSDGQAFASLLRRIPSQRIMRRLHHQVSAVWAASGTSEPMSIEQIVDRYEKLPKGDA